MLQSGLRDGRKEYSTPWPGKNFLVAAWRRLALAGVSVLSNFLVKRAKPILFWALISLAFIEPLSAVSLVQPLWNFTTAAGVYSSPAVGYDGTIYVGSLDGQLYALSSNGQKKWSFSTGGAVYASPAIGVDGAILIGSVDGKIYAVHPDGTRKWVFAAAGEVYASAAVGRNGIIYFGTWTGMFYSLDSDGAKLWSFRSGGHIWSSPAIGADGTIYFGADDNKLYALYPDGTLKWTVDLGGYIWGSPAIGLNGIVYIGSGDKNIYAINPDGTIRWAFATGNHVWSSPSIGPDGTIYAGSLDGKLYALFPDGTLKWAYSTGTWIYSSPAIGADGVIYVGCGDHRIYAIGMDGTNLWTFETGNFIRSSPVLADDGTLYAGSYDNNIYAIRAQSGGLAASPWSRFHHDSKGSGLWVWTPDETSPRVSSVSPADGTSGVGVRTRISVTFSEAVDPSTLSGGSVTLTAAANSTNSVGSSNIEGAISYRGATATFAPLAKLQFDTTYLVTVGAGVTDLSGNSMGATYTYEFMTGPPDLVSPFVAGTSPADGSFDVLPNSQISVTFSEPIEPSTIYANSFFVARGATHIPGIISYDGGTATLVPAIALESGIQYVGTVTAEIQDLAGNGLASTHTWSFKTKTESKTESNAEPKVEPKVEPWAEPKAEIDLPGGQPPISGTGQDQLATPGQKDKGYDSGNGVANGVGDANTEGQAEGDKPADVSAQPNERISSADSGGGGCFVGQAGAIDFDALPIVFIIMAALLDSIGQVFKV